MLADKLDCNQTAFRIRTHTRKAARDAAGQTARFIRHAVPFPTDTEVQRKVLRYFPVVLEKQVHFVGAPVPALLENAMLISLELQRRLRRSQVETLPNEIDGTCQVI